ncbi:isovaleryl-CoA dehydrogenase [Salinisphaera aquimarina]|uniref:Isovaleryl-CoA dehydrogenase n=1 Tax=Salinisphaera aquimarina TaxID=2094031 RepID=A0ABV7ENI1_9GAMM
MNPSPLRPRTTLATHDVTNQPPPLIGYNAFTSDPALMEAIAREGGDWGTDRLKTYGAIAGDELIAIGFEANENPPRLKTFDRFGHRLDEVEFHPAYHRSMALAKEHGLHGLTWTGQRAGAQVIRSGLIYMHNQMESGTMCPITMTHAAVPALRHAPEIAAEWLPGILANVYDPACRPAAEKQGLTIGMGMTEKQGGSDVRSNTTRATAQGDGRYTLVGHKWFFSAPMCDAFLVLAQEATGPGDGLSCFLLPRWRRDGSRNAIQIQRLKDKLGDRSNASSEVEFVDAEAWRIGEAGRGVPTIIEMVSQTRLDCMLGSAGLMRQALVQAIHHCRHRDAFGTRLIEQPLMTHVLADMALESEAAIALALRLARAFESDDEQEKQLARVATPVGKYLICKTAPPLINEAQECLGGAGYVEESILPRLFRQSPLNSIWEGSGNVQCLDMLRAMGKSPASIEALQAELAAARGAHPAYDAHCDALEQQLRSDADNPVHARRMAEAVARALQARILLTGDAPWVGEAFCAARLTGGHGMAYGTLNTDLDFAGLVARAFPG